MIRLLLLILYLLYPQHNLLSRLGDTNFSTRRDASKELEGMGYSALPTLYYGLRSDDCEVKRRCEVALQPLQEHWYWSKRRVYILALLYSPGDCKLSDNRFWEVYKADLPFHLEVVQIAKAGGLLNSEYRSYAQRVLEGEGESEEFCPEYWQRLVVEDLELARGNYNGTR